ncbi:hypothetical protein Droror1_Dr00021603 [Drosera rotundifolia]
MRKEFAWLSRGILCLQDWGSLVEGLAWTERMIQHSLLVASPHLCEYVAVKRIALTSIVEAYSCTKEMMCFHGYYVKAIGIGLCNATCEHAICMISFILEKLLFKNQYKFDI